jgi:transposase InsO family protein
MSPVQADAPKVLWAIDFQFDSTTDGKAIKIASMIDEHTRCSLMHIVERSITAERLVFELEKAFAVAGGPPVVLRMDNGSELVSQALQRFCDGKAGMVYISPGCPWDNGYIQSFNNRLRKECLNRNHWNTLFEARAGQLAITLHHSARLRQNVLRGHRRLQDRTQPPTPHSPWATARRPSTLPHAGAPTPRWPARSIEHESHQPDSKTGWSQ